MTATHRILEKWAIGLIVATAMPAAIVAVGVEAKDSVADRTPPALSWWVEQEGKRGAQGFHSVDDRMDANSGTTYLISASAQDDTVLDRLSLGGMGSFHCATRDGSWAAPYEIVMAIPDRLETQEIAAGQQARTQGRIQLRLRVASISCGLHPVPGQPQPQELFATSGKIVLRSAAADMNGGEAQGALHISTLAGDGSSAARVSATREADTRLVAWR